MGIMKLLGTSFSTILNGGNPTADRTITFPDASGQALLDTLFSGTSALLATNGYQKLPNGLIIQWGVSAATTTGASGTFTFPIAFTNSCFYANYVAVTADTVGTANPVITAVTTTSFTFVNKQSNTTTFRCFAIGY